MNLNGDSHPDCEYTEPALVIFLQGSRGIQGPQGAVGKKGENVSEHTFVCAIHSCSSVQRVCQMKSTNSSACFFRVCRVLMEKMAHLVFLESK